MYRSKIAIQRKTTPILKRYLNLFLQEHTYVVCKALKNRKVFLSELPKAMIQRKDVGSRLRCFWVGVDIVRRSNNFTQRVVNGKREYEFQGLSFDGKMVFVHFREEIRNKDRRLIILSTYYK